jgi:hypothetical protein
VRKLQLPKVKRESRERRILKENKKLQVKVNIRKVQN